jgi:antitoxin MazE
MKCEVSTLRASFVLRTRLGRDSEKMSVMIMQQPRSFRIISRMGNSLGVGIPKEIVEMMKIKQGDEYEVIADIEQNQIILKPTQRVRLPENVRPEIVDALDEVFTKYDQVFKNLKHR